MSIFAKVLYFFFSDIRTIIISLIIGLIVYKISKFYYRVYSLPPGPTPLPLIGNILLFRTKTHWTSVFKQLTKKYGSVYTVWLGKYPYVVITDIDKARDLFRKNAFSGRPDFYFGSHFSNTNHTDVIFTDFGHTWEALRRVAHSAVQKYSSNEKLVDVANDCVDSTIKLIIDREGTDSAFKSYDYTYYMFLNILGTIAFGRSYGIEDKEYKQIKYVIKDSIKELQTRFFLWEFSPIMRIIDKKMVNKQKTIYRDMIAMLSEKFRTHYTDYNDTVVRDFCDALISAKNDALREGKESAPYLTDQNLAMTVYDLFFAGTDTSQQTFQWILLLITYYPEIQKKLRQEIESEIGDRFATHEDRSRCHYVMAVISETLRFRNVVPLGVPHKAVVTTSIGEYTIPGGTTLMVNQHYILNDPKHWSNPDQFIPERFLANGKYITSRSSAFIPFSVGRRVCLGEKLAIADLFLVLVRFLQSTSDYDIVLHSSGGLDPDPNDTIGINPMDFKICLNKIK